MRIQGRQRKIKTQCRRQNLKHEERHKVLYNQEQTYFGDLHLMYKLDYIKSTPPPLKKPTQVTLNYLETCKCIR